MAVGRELHLKSIIAWFEQLRKHSLRYEDICCSHDIVVSCFFGFSVSVNFRNKFVTYSVLAVNHHLFVVCWGSSNYLNHLHLVCLVVT